MFPSLMFNSASIARDASIRSGPNQVQEFGSCTQRSSVSSDQPQEKTKKRNLQGNPVPDVEVVALSPDSLTATHRFFCEICNKGFTRDQNLQLHRRGHNLPWKLKQRTVGKEMKIKKYVCPEPTCIHHKPLKALGDITGIKKHFLRKHYDGEKKWKCEKCSKLYAVESDLKAHSKTCGTKEYTCTSHTIFSRKESFLTHGIHCDSLAEENAKSSAPKNSTNSTQSNLHINPPPPPPPPSFFPFPSSHCHYPDTWNPLPQNPNTGPQIHMSNYDEPCVDNFMMWSLFRNSQSVPTTTLSSLASTGLLQKAAKFGAVGQTSSTICHLDMNDTATWQQSTDPFTRDFLGMTYQCGNENVNRGEGSAEVLSYFGEADYQPPNRGHSFSKPQGFNDQSSPDTWGNYW